MMMYTEDEKNLLIDVIRKKNPTDEQLLIIKMRRIIEDQQNIIKSLENDIALIKNHFNDSKEYH